MKHFNGDIRIIGPRPSGKLTYLATLACFPHKSESNLPVKSIQPLNLETEELIVMAENILVKGATLSPMFPTEAPENMSLYSLRITFYNKFNLLDIFSSRFYEIRINIRPYAGEIFQDLLCQEISNKMSLYLDDLATVKQIILLIDAVDSPAKRDQEYAQALEILEQELNSRLNSTDKANYRLAVVFSKFDQAPAWTYRHNVEDFVSRKFPRTKSVIIKWSQSWQYSVDYFACSAFGMVGNPPRPNVTQGKWGALAKPEEWRPFGLVSPIYWLCTGKRDSSLEHA